MDKDIKETSKTIYEQSENINKDIKITTWNQIEILELKSKIIEMKKSLEGFDISLI